MQELFSNTLMLATYALQSVAVRECYEQCNEECGNTQTHLPEAGMMQLEQEGNAQ